MSRPPEPEARSADPAAEADTMSSAGRDATLVRRRGRDRAERSFTLVTSAAGALILAVLAAVAAFLLIEAWPALSATPEELSAISWLPEDGSLARYVVPLVFEIGRAHV